MGQRARQRVQRLFGWNEYLEAYESLYRRLAQEAHDTSISDAVHPSPAGAGSSEERPLKRSLGAAQPD
jgi:hypothetical protein